MEKYIFKSDRFTSPMEADRSAEMLEMGMLEHGFLVRAYGLGRAVRVCPPYEFDPASSEEYLECLAKLAVILEVVDFGPESKYPEYCY